MENLKNNNEIDMLYTYVIPGFNITNYESQSNFVVQNIKFVSSKFTNPPFLFLIHTYYSYPPCLLTNLLTQPFFKMWNFFYPTLSKGWTPHSGTLRVQNGHPMYRVLALCSFNL